MRLRVQLLPPFADTKLLLPLPDSVRTVTDVKQFVRQSLSSVRDIAGSSKDLLLEIDGFELLPGSLVKDVIEDKDVVTIRLRAGSSRLEGSGKTRKRESTDTSLVTKRRKVYTEDISGQLEESIVAGTEADSKQPVDTRARKPSLAPSNVSSSSSSASSSSSSASSDSSLSSDSSSTSDSSTDSSSGDTTASPRQAPALQPVLPAIGHPAARVPPGKGKLTTHERNERRKRARLYQKQDAQGVLPEPVDGEGGDAGPEQMSLNANANTVSFTSSELPVPKSMANRNKKKGFLKEMNNVKGTKTVFGDDAQASSTPIKAARPGESVSVTEDSTSATPTNDVSEGTTHRTPVSRRVVPPSEMELPSNVFVTHQVYDRHGWAPRGRRGRGQYNESRVTDHGGLEEEEEDKEEPEAVPYTTAMELEEVEETHTLVEGGEAEARNGDSMWEKAESGFDTLTLVNNVQILQKGTKLAWKELQLDMYSFSPQIKVQLGEVAEISGTQMLVHRLERLDGDEDDPYNGQGRELLVELSSLEKDLGRYRLL